MLTRLKSALSTVTSTLQAVRELPGVMKEAIAFTRENSEVKRELEAANAQLDTGLNLHQEWMVRCIERDRELDLWRSWCRAVTSESVDLDDEQLRRAVEKQASDIVSHWSTVAGWWQSECNDLCAKLARYEAAEKWLSQWRWNKVTPCPFPPDTFVQYRECEQVTPSSPNENHANEPLKEMSHTCMVSELSDSDEWRPHVECLQFYEAFKNV